jgi:hypothetical protein
MISRGGYTVVTTFQQKDMEAAQQAVRTNLSSLDPTGNPADQNVHAGLAAIDTTTGAVLGFYGGPDYLKQGFDDALQAAGPVGSDVSIALADGVSATPRQNWPDAINALGQLGVSDANTKDIPPSDDDFTSTPLHAAGAFMVASNGGQYHQPYEVSEVLYQGKVIWQASTSTVSYVGNSKALRQNGPLASGIDGSAQWAWSLADINRVSVAVDIYATKPNGVTNRTLSGMTPMPETETGQKTASGSSAPSTPVSRAYSITLGFMQQAVFPNKPGLSDGSVLKGGGFALPPGSIGSAGLPSRQPVSGGSPTK